MLANLEIWERSQREPRFKGMGTTCVACYFLDDALIIGHVGDSRCYRVARHRADPAHRGSLADQRLHPHEAGHARGGRELAAQERDRARARHEGERAGRHPDREAALGDTYLLCSDGLTGMIKDDQMQHILMTERDLDHAVERLITAANEEGGVDNISVVLARVEAP